MRSWACVPAEHVRRSKKRKIRVVGDIEWPFLWLRIPGQRSVNFFYAVYVRLEIGYMYLLVVGPLWSFKGRVWGQMQCGPSLQMHDAPLKVHPFFCLRNIKKLIQRGELYHIKHLSYIGISHVFSPFFSEHANYPPMDPVIPAWVKFSIVDRWGPPKINSLNWGSWEIFAVIIFLFPPTTGSPPVS